MADTQLYEFRASEIPGLLRCSERIMYRRRQKSFHSSAESVGKVLGTRVHSLITGQAFQKPARIAYDDATRSFKELEGQARVMAAKAHEMLADAALEPIDREVEMVKRVGFAENKVLKIVGHADLICLDGEGRHVLLDLKTGLRPPSDVWQQLAIYLYLAEDPAIVEAGVLWMIRKAGYVVNKRGLERRPSEDLVRHAPRMVQQLVSICYHGTIAVPSHSDCPTCIKQGCPVRCAPPSKGTLAELKPASP